MASKEFAFLRDSIIEPARPRWRTARVCPLCRRRLGRWRVALLLALRDRREPLPAAAFTLSAVTDLTCSGESMQTRAAEDIMINPKLVPETAALYCHASRAEASICDGS